MPRLPRLIANAMEKVYSKLMHDVQVTNTTYYNEFLKKVTLEGDLSKTKFTTGQVVEFRINDTDFRHYTPSYFDDQRCDILFYLHDKGLGSKWANDLTVGQKLKLMGPGGKMSYNADFTSHFVFGDETSVGLMQCMQAEALKNDHTMKGLLEVASAHLPWQDTMSISNTEWIENDYENPGMNALFHFRDHIESRLPLPNCVFYLTGRKQSIKVMKNYLVSIGVAKKQLQIYPYWAKGKQGL